MRHRLLFAGLVLAACGCGQASSGATSDARTPAAVSPPAARPAAVSAGDWPMFGRGPARTSATGAIGIGPAQAAHLRRSTIALPGTVDSAPIFLHGVRAGGARRDLFLMTTSYGRTVAVDPAAGRVVWTFTPRGYGSWAGSYRIMNATPAASGDRRFVFAGSPDGLVHKIAVATGREAGGRWPVRITRLPEREKVTPSFGVFGNRVIVGTGGYVGDQPPYQGHLVAIDARSGRIDGVTNSLCANRHTIIRPSTCSASDSAFWSRNGAVRMSDGTLIFATGNAPFDGRTNFGDSVIRVSADGSRLLGSWTPANHAELNDADADLGSTGPVPIGGGSILQAGKDAKMHVFAVAALRHRGSVGHERQLFATPGGQMMFSSPATWHTHGRTYVFATTSGGTGAYVASHGRLRQVWSNGSAGTSPIVAGGLLYVYDPGGALNVYRPQSGTRIAHLPAGSGHWNSPAPGLGVVALPEGSANDHDAGHGTLSLYRRG